jgi:hypothetical protein
VRAQAQYEVAAVEMDPKKRRQRLLALNADDDTMSRREKDLYAAVVDLQATALQQERWQAVNARERARKLTLARGDDAMASAILGERGR